MRFPGPDTSADPTRVNAVIRQAAGVSRGPETQTDQTVIRRVPLQSPLGIGMTLVNGTYVIEAFLARGGMGEVYRARHCDHGTEYAIKVILPSLASDDTVVQLFIREARELGRINNDAIVR